MPIHAQVLDAAVRLCRARRGWTFRPIEIVAALPGLNAASVRTHIMSRCCVNAPAHHPHRWPYFRRTSRGIYQILPAVRNRRPQTAPAAARSARPESRGAGPRLQVSPSPEAIPPLIAAYARDIDRTLIRENLRLSVEERLDKQQRWADSMDEIRGAAWRSRPGAGDR